MLQMARAADRSMDLRRYIEVEVEEHYEAFRSTSLMLEAPLTRALDITEHAIRRGGKLLLFGNGGSAADAQHLAAELIVRYKAARPPISAIALTTDTSALTACGNDLGFEALFERQIEALGRDHDVAIGLSTSGQSVNVLRALRLARRMGLGTVGFTGCGGEEMAAHCDVLFAVPSPVTARVQEMHIMIGHFFCKALEMRLGGV